MDIYSLGTIGISFVGRLFNSNVFDPQPLSLENHDRVYVKILNLIMLFWRWMLRF